SANTISARRRRSSDPSPRRTSAPKRSTMASSAGWPRSVTSRASASASTTAAPRSASQPATVDLPQPIGPVSPILNARSPLAVTSRPSEVGARAPLRHPPEDSRAALLELQPRVLGRGERDVDVGQLTADSAELDKVALDVGVAHRQLEVAPPQPEARELRLGQRLLPPVRILRQFLSASGRGSTSESASCGRERDGLPGCGRRPGAAPGKATVRLAVGRGAGTPARAAHGALDRPAARHRRTPRPLAALDR